MFDLAGPYCGDGPEGLIPRHFFYLDMLYQYAGVCLTIVSAHQS